MHRENAYFQGLYDWIQIKSFWSETYNARFQSILNSLPKIWNLNNRFTHQSINVENEIRAMEL